MSGTGSPRLVRALIVSAVAAIASALPAAAKTAGIEEKCGGVTMPDGGTCEITLITYAGDPENVQLKGPMALPDGLQGQGPVEISLGHWRKPMYQNGNMNLIRHICTRMQTQMREKGLIPR